jgi:hypothetical protein
MPVVTPRLLAATRLGVAPVVLFAAAVALSAQPPDPAKKPADPPKLPAPKPAPPAGLRLPDGTFLWTGPGTTDGERVLLTPQDHQKLLDQIDQLKKQLAARKAVPPSGCAVKGKVEKRGEALVAALKVTYTFRTAAPTAAVALGGKRAFLVAATLDGNKLPVLDTGEDGFAALVETAGDHVLVLDLECPVSGRGTKTEIGFDLGLPRAAITTLALDPPPGVPRVNLLTRTPDPAPLAKPVERRVPALEVKQLAPRPGHAGYPLGPVELVEVAWEPPAAAAPVEAVQAATIDVTCLLADGFVETTAKVAPRGPARVWRVAAPADAVFTVDRATVPAKDAGPDTGSSEAPAVTKPADANKPVWKVELPAGTAAADWTITAVVRNPRAKAADPKHKGPFPVGPFAVLDVARQTGTVRVAAAANTRLAVKHGPDVRQDVPPAPTGDETVAFFRFATGPTGAAAPAAPLLEVEARPLAGTVEVRPAYKLTLADARWRVRAELKVVPIRREIDTLLIELPAGWHGPVVSPPEVVEGVEPVKSDGPGQVLSVRLAAGHRQPFDLVLTADVPVPPAAQDAAVALPRFPGVSERDAAVTVTVPDGQEVRGTGREWDADQPAAGGQPLAPVPGPDGKPPKAATSIAGKFDRGLARVEVAWAPYRPELTADVRAEVTVHDGQVVVAEKVRLRSPDGFPRPVRFRGAPGVRALPPLTPVGPGEWAVAPAAELKEVNLSFEFPVALPPRPADGPRKVPVGLVWPVGATRTESVVRVWSNSVARRAIAADLDAWRALPPEPVADRAALPVLTLAGAGADLPLVLDVGDAAETTAATAWADRGLVQVWVGGDDSAACRARFLLTRWLADAVEVALPEAAGPPEVLLDGRKVDAVPTSSASGRSVRVPLPEGKPGRSAVLEVRFPVAAGRAGPGAVFTPPRLPAAAVGPVRWQVTVPGGRVPLVVGGHAEQRWAVRTGLLTPVGASTDALEEWFRTAADPDDGAGAADAAVVRLTGAESVRVYHAPRVGLVVVGSVVLVVVGLVVLRLPGAAAGPVVAVLGGAAAVAAVLVPQPTAQAAGAAVPGLAGLGLVLLIQLAARGYYRHRVTHLPGFSRGRPEPVPGPSASGGSGSAAPRGGSRNGSTGPHDVLPSGSQPVAPSAG